MIFLSCGHREDDFDNHYSITTKSYTRENGKALSYMTVCYGCMRLYEEAGQLFNSDKEAMDWLQE